MLRVNRGKGTLEGVVVLESHSVDSSGLIGVDGVVNRVQPTLSKWADEAFRRVIVFFT